jgi:peptide/nickel transport system substrate-binding protein
MTVRATRNRRPRVVLLTAGAVALSLLAAGCSGKAGGSASTSASGGGAAYTISKETPAPKGDIDSFTWADYAAPESMDYAYAYDYPINTILSNVCESLLRWNPDLSISPNLAEKFSNPTPTTWVYDLRSGVTFHDGTTMTADDVVASLKRHLDPNVGSYWNSVFKNVKSIVKTGPLQVTVTLTQPDSMFNQYMAVSPGTVDSAATFKADGADYGNPNKLVNCTGPFSIASWKSGENMVLQRYDNYWNAPAKAKAKQVTFVFLQDPNTRINALTSGQVDGSWDAPSNAYAQLQAPGAPGKLYFGINTVVDDFIVSNLTGALKDVRMRQALMMALDRAGMVKTAEKGYAKITNSLVTQNNWLGVPQDQIDKIYADLPQYPYDLEKAKALAKEAGANGQKVVIATSPMGDNVTIATTALAAAVKAIGLDPVITTISPDKYTELFSSADARKGIDLYHTTWYTSLADPEEMYSTLRCGEFANYGNWCNNAFEAADKITMGSPVGSEARQTAMVTQQKIAATELPWLPLYEVPQSLWLGKKITGVHPSVYYLYSPWANEIGAA